MLCSNRRPVPGRHKTSWLTLRYPIFRITGNVTHQVNNCDGNHYFSLQALPLLQLRGKNIELFNAWIGTVLSCTLFFRLMFGISWVILLTSPVSAQTEGSLKLGIFPYVNPAQLVKFHGDFRALLEETLNHKVVMVTAPSFKDFIKRTRDNEYDYIMTAPHLGRLAEVRDGYVPIVHTMHKVQGVYLVRKDSDIKELEDLKGKVLTMVGPRAIITQMAQKQLRALGLQDGVNITFRYTKTHNNAMYAPLRGESDASFTGVLLWQKIGQKNLDEVRVIGKTPETIGFQVMAASRVAEADRLKVQKALLECHRTKAGKNYLNKTGFRSFDIVDEQEKQHLDQYIQIFLRE
ncbi:MAG TPA: phosphate/phosphite/phosphonate ABC transporter substrate-binding protein [Chromatiales bacterium]|nr:phosphate/phosphite/phosphonate ABC transporter substrate-binding protein [Thiotrichales bacterium]HIP67030.1 phosphate/phosphite/phosphonate ABC transporter substrate-binding protein [Chromatiales bacterium]